AKGVKGAVKGHQVLSKKKVLFHDSDSSSPSSEDDQEDGGAALASASASQLKINDEYACKFEHNKKREELQRLEEKYKTANASDDSESSEDETEDDEAVLVTEDLDAEISATLRAIKNKDPRIYDKDAVFYKPIDPEDEPVKEKEEKPLFLKDYHRERYLRGDVGVDLEDEADPDVPMTYAREQADLKKSILSEINAAAEDEGWSDDDAFIKPTQKKEEAPENGIHPSPAVAIKLTEVDVKKADEDPEEFLSKFMASKAWAPPKGSKWEAFESDEGDDDDDDDLADQVEHAYNMRFEDPAKANQVLKSYSRDAANARSVRKEELKGRKRLRQLEKEKKEAEKKQREEERARLRRLKVEEASDRLAKIKKAAGISGKTLTDEEWVKFLDDAWDDDKWEEEMTKRFGEDYYAEADELWRAEEEQYSDGDDDEDSGADDGKDGKKKKAKKTKPKKPKWDDDIDIKDIIPDFEDDEVPKVSLSDDKATPEAAAAGGSDEDDDASEAERPSKKRKTATKDLKKERIAAQRQAREELAKVEALVDTKMELENPRILAASPSKKGGASGDVPTFRYRETSPNVFGMTPRDILLAPSDAALNEFAGLKKLATFRDAEKKRKDKKHLGKKARLRQWRRETFGREFEHTGPTFGFDGLPEATGANAAQPQQQEQKQEQQVQQPPPAAAAAAGADNIVNGERKKKRKRSK
ncbi:KRI1-like family-domain-containing protein, partial [Lasiosphaeria miniovina]